MSPRPKRLAAAVLAAGLALTLTPVAAMTASYLEELDRWNERFPGEPVSAFHVSRRLRLG